MVTALVAAAGTQSQKPQQKSTPAPASTPAQVASGKQIYALQCSVCHFAQSTEKKIGPGMKGIYLRGKFAGGEKVDDESMRKWIESGGKDMPAFKDSLKPNEVRDLLAYLHTL
jgi:cytochrome c